MLIIHDYVEQTDGGSRLCLELARGLKAEFLCGFVKKDHPFLKDDDLFILHTLMPNIAIPLLRQWLLAQAFYRRSRSLQKKHNCIIYSGSYAPLAVHGHLVSPKNKQNEIESVSMSEVRNILYCHTPPRFLYDEHEAFSLTIKSVMRPLFRAFCHWLRPLYEDAISKMDVIIANSEAVQNRIKKYLGKSSQVIYPPCNTADYYWEKPQGYFLSMVRLDHMKRVDLLIKAFRLMPHLKLVISSDGSEGKKLRFLSSDCTNIIFTGVLSEKKRLDMLAKCISTICVAREEDFGMCAVESLAAGKPVIIAAAGGLKEIIIDGENGVHLAANPKHEDIIEAVCSMEFKATSNMLDMRHACQNRAKTFDISMFLEKIRQIIG